MNNSPGINCRISKVNEQLERLAYLIEDDCNLYRKTKQALNQFNQSESSQDSFGYFQSKNSVQHQNQSKPIKASPKDDFYQQILCDIEKSTGMWNGVLKKSTMQDQQKLRQPIANSHGAQTADVTVKKFGPVCNRNKKKQSQQKIYQQYKIKNYQLSNKVLINSKPEIIRKCNSKQQKQMIKSSQPSQLNHQGKGVYKKLKTTLNIKSNSQSRLNQIPKMKMNIHLKKYMNMKIMDLNIQKQQCKKQAQYLKAVMKIQQEQKLQQISRHIDISCQQSFTLILMIRLIINFFSQFFDKKHFAQNECITNLQIKQILDKKNYLLKYMYKLPDILENNHTLNEQKCKKFYNDKDFIDHHIQSKNKKIFSTVSTFYILFMIDNHVIKQTKRQVLPIYFHSERSTKANQNNNRNNRNSHTNTEITNINGVNKDKQTQQAIRTQIQRKSDGKTKNQVNKFINNYTNRIKSGLNIKPTSKNPNNQKLTSPQGKPAKDTYINNYHNIHHCNSYKEK